ncbi:MAG: hypothetical protein EPO19_01220 [Betaproteobacteria bacterium]|nr:MAG: hypothetical protein EPO19_01220 [Betaproteobacteria bacterium]
MLDNHVHHRNKPGIDARRIAWKRVVPINRFTSDTAAEVEMLTARIPFARVDIALRAFPPGLRFPDVKSGTPEEES